MVEQVQHGIEQESFPMGRKRALSQTSQRLHLSSFQLGETWGGCSWPHFLEMAAGDLDQKVLGRELLLQKAQRHTMGHNQCLEMKASGLHWVISPYWPGDATRVTAHQNPYLEKQQLQWGNESGPTNGTTDNLVLTWHLLPPAHFGLLELSIQEEQLSVSVAACLLFQISISAAICKCIEVYRLQNSFLCKLLLKSHYRKLSLDFELKPPSGAFWEETAPSSHGELSPSATSERAFPALSAVSHGVISYPNVKRQKWTPFRLSSHSTLIASWLSAKPLQWTANPDILSCVISYCWSSLVCSYTSPRSHIIVWYSD